MHKIIFFSKKKYVCLPYLKFSDLLPETHLLFYLALAEQFILVLPDYVTYPKKGLVGCWLCNILCANAHILKEKWRVKMMSIKVLLCVSNVN